MSSMAAVKQYYGQGNLMDLLAPYTRAAHVPRPEDVS